MIEVFSVLYAIVKAVPAIQRAWDSFLAFYVEREIATNREKRNAGVDALKKAKTDEELLAGLKSLIGGSHR